MKPSHFNLPEGACNSVGEVLARIGDKWSVLIIVMLEDGSQRFSELRSSIDSVSQKMLTSTLRHLERDGFVTRTVTPSIPPRVDYELTEMGRDVLVPVRAMATWALSRREQVEAARLAFDHAQAKASKAVAEPARKRRSCPGNVPLLRGRSTAKRAPAP